MWRDVQKFIGTYESFLITSHVNPDGDAIGSEMALKIFLESLDKNVIVVNASPTPSSLVFLDPEGEIKIYNDRNPASFLDDVDAIFILDLNNWEQLGNLAKPLRASSLPSVCIDHHQGADAAFADVVVSDTSAAATGVLIHELTRSMNAESSRELAEALYAALITDTGTFRFSNTDSRVLRIAADLIDAGADAFATHKRVFASKSWGSGLLLGPVMDTLSQRADGRLVWIYATQDMVKAAGASYDDMDGYVDLARSIEGVELVLFFKETPDGHIKVSLRSNGKVDAFAIARHFGGGGHRMAAGMRLDGPIDAAIKTATDACVQMDGIREP